MASPTRILYITGEVIPYTPESEVASLVRALPEELNEVTDVDARLFMPRYGTISERKNSLHEVIRLSGTDVPMGDSSEEVTVKVATVPDTRLQVYFMDNGKYYKRKAVAHDDNGDPFKDNPERALFLAQSVLRTIKKLRWAPDVVHAFGWASALVPALLRSQYSADEIIGKSRTVFTPDNVDSGPQLAADVIERLQLPFDGEGKALNEIGESFADATIYPANLQESKQDVQRFNGQATRAEQLLELYSDLLDEVAA